MASRAPATRPNVSASSQSPPKSGGRLVPSPVVELFCAAADSLQELTNSDALPAAP